jgi:nucleotide-binding universal stress UspA family protein
LKGFTMAYKTIVCGVTGSAHARKAALQAAKLAKRDGAKLVFVYAVDDSFSKNHGRTVEVSSEFVNESLEILGGHILDHAERIARHFGITPEKVLRRGPVLEVLKEVVAEKKGDLLMIGHEERSFFDRIFLKGSVEDHLLELRNQTGIEVDIIK